MDIGKFLEIMDLAENLKNNPRHSWTSSGRRESVAEHSWRLTLITIVVLIVVSMRKKKENQPPAHLGLAYFREER